MSSTDFSELRISDEIIASIVVNSCKDCKGIFCFEKKPFKFKNLFNNGENLKYVEIKNYDKFYIFSLYIKVFNSFSIPQLVSQVKERVKKSVEIMTEKEVKDVKVNIVSVEFDELSD